MGQMPQLPPVLEIIKAMVQCVVFIRRRKVGTVCDERYHSLRCQSKNGAREDRAVAGMGRTVHRGPPGLGKPAPSLNYC